jgi:hypothetical protein
MRVFVRVPPFGRPTASKKQREQNEIPPEIDWLNVVDVEPI